MYVYIYIHLFEKIYTPGNQIDSAEFGFGFFWKIFLLFHVVNLERPSQTNVATVLTMN